MSSPDSHDGPLQETPTPPAATFGAEHLPAARNKELFSEGDVVDGSYQIISKLGRGAMGMVYRARHITMDAEYALKVLTTEQLNDVAVMRFQNEAQALAKLNHQNLIGIYNFGLHEGRWPFYVMDLLIGDNLLEKLDAYGPMPVNLALPVFIEVCSGLSYAHRKGILHRDVKPANFVMLDAPDVRGATVKIVDFGLVKFAEELKPDAQKLTAMGDVCGSPSYMSPEQTSGSKIDPRADVYSLGCSLYQVLTGKLPFVGRNAAETMMMQHEKAVPTLASKGDGRTYSPDLERLVAKMMAKAPMDRYQTMESVAQDLKNVIAGRPLGSAQNFRPEQSTTPSAMTSPGAVTSPGAMTIPPKFSTRATSISGSPYDIASSESQTLGGNTSASSQISAGTSGRSQSLRGYGSDNKAQGFGSQAAPQERPTFQKLDFSNISTSPLDVESAAAVPKIRPGRNRLIAISAGALVLLSVLGFFGWQALQPTKTISQALGLPDSTGGGSQTTSTSSDPYFSKTIKENGREYIQFNFPLEDESDNLGYIGSDPRHWSTMAGQVRCPTDLPIFIAPSMRTLKSPHFFEKFRPGEITGVTLLSDISPTDELLIKAVKIPGVKNLYVEGSQNLTAAIIPAIANLKLQAFLAPAIKIDSTALSRVHFWPYLQLLDVTYCNNLNVILKQLKDSTNMEMLNISGTHATAGDYQLIATMPNLTYLNLSGDHVSKDDLRTLSSLRHLERLELIMCRFADGAPVEELKLFHSLRWLKVEKDSFTVAELQNLKHFCPHLHVKEVDSRHLHSFAEMAAQAQKLQNDPGEDPADKEGGPMMLHYLGLKSSGATAEGKAAKPPGASETMKTLKDLRDGHGALSAD